MIKLDKKFIDEFLGTEGELTVDYSSPCKTWRMYEKGNGKILMVRTPLMHDFDFDELIRPIRDLGQEVPTMTHYNRGKYLLTVFSFSNA